MSSRHLPYLLLFGFLFYANVTFAACGFGSDIGSNQCRGYIVTTGASTWPVPTDWTTTNSIETIGAGGAGAAQINGGAQTVGGGGGAYSKITNLTGLTPGGSVSYAVGATGTPVTNDSGNTGGDTWFGATSMANCVTAGSSSCVGAKGGGGGVQNASLSPEPGGPGGDLASGVGTTKFSGGNGSQLSDQAFSTGGGGGAAGLGGAGARGGNETAAAGNTVGSTGGGGASGGTAGGDITVSGTTAGTNGGNGTGTGGLGGPASGNSNGAVGGAGAGGGGGEGRTSTATAGNGGNGGAGTDWDSGHGAGGGGGGGGTINTSGTGGTGGNGGLFGGGGGGGGTIQGGNSAPAGSGAQGIITIIYTVGGSAPRGELKIFEGMRLVIQQGGTLKIQQSQ
jgi:hypothetical protein